MRIRPQELCSDCANGEKLEQMPGFYNCSVLSSPVQTPSHCLYYRGSRLPVDVVIVAAVPVERDAVLNELHPEGPDAWEPLTTVGNGIWRTCLYRSGQDSRASVRLALAKTRLTGLSAAASLTALAIQLFRPSHVVMLGVTAGRQGKTAIGDIVIPLELWDYGAGKWEEREGRLVFKPRGERQPLDEHVRQWCEDLATRKEARRRFRDEWMARQPDRPAYATPEVHFGPMVSGAAVVDAEAIWQHILQQNDKVLAVDMEAYGVALATHCASTPHYHPCCLIAKSVCDYGTRKEKDAQPYAAYTSVCLFKLYLDEFILGTDSRRAPARLNVPATE